ncbi:hypothetical protein Avbf_00292 [Armadillidium vulgare]|nr:hypothetical protein Avbf_00292 [Armadillidium vulgare]
MEIEVKSENSLKEHDKLLNESIIREWLAENRNNLEKCYPTEEELDNLAKKTGNSIKEVERFLSNQRLKILVNLILNDSSLKRSTKSNQSSKGTASHSMAENTKSEVKSDNSVNERKHNLDERQRNLILKYLTENWKNLEKCYPADTELNNIAKTIGATKEEVNSFLSNNRLKFLINLKREDKNLKKNKQNYKCTQDSSVKSQQEQQSSKKIQPSKMLEKPRENQPSRQQNKPKEDQLSRQQGNTKEQQKMPKGNQPSQQQKYPKEQPSQEQKNPKEQSQLQKKPQEKSPHIQKKTKEQPSQQQKKPKDQQSEPLKVPQLCRVLQRQQCKYTKKNTPSWQQEIYSDSEELLDSSQEDLLVDKDGNEEENSSKRQNLLNLLMQENAEERYLNVQQVANESDEELMSDSKKNMEPKDEDAWRELIMANKHIIFPEATEKSLDVMN